MPVGSVIGFAGLLVISLAAFTISWLQFREKGFLFNNAYLFATKRERQTMNKKPHYRQSAIIFLLLAIAFLLLALELLLELWWLFPVILAYIGIVLVYAVVSTIRIEKMEK